MSDANNVALVTGASSGIGLEFAKLLAVEDSDFIRPLAGSRLSSG